MYHSFFHLLKVSFLVVLLNVRDSRLRLQHLSLRGVSGQTKSLADLAFPSKLEPTLNTQSRPFNIFPRLVVPNRFTTGKVFNKGSTTSSFPGPVKVLSVNDLTGRADPGVSDRVSRDPQWFVSNSTDRK